MLSPPMATTRIGIGSRPSSFIVHPDVSAVAVRTEVATTLSLGPIMDFASHTPATSDNFIALGCWAAPVNVTPASSIAVAANTRRIDVSLELGTGSGKPTRRWTTCNPCNSPVILPPPHAAARPRSDIRYGRGNERPTRQDPAIVGSPEARVA